MTFVGESWHPSRTLRLGTVSALLALSSTLSTAPLALLALLAPHR